MDEPVQAQRPALADLDVSDALRSYLTFHLKGLGEDGSLEYPVPWRPRTELLSELRLACSPPAPTLEPFYTRVVAFQAKTSARVEFRDPPNAAGRRELLADRVFVRSCFDYHDEEWKEVGRDLSRLGGFVKAAFRAARHVVAGAVARAPIKALVDHWDDTEWSTWLARTCDVTVRMHPSRDLPACLVKTPARRVIWLSQDLPAESRTLAILHELAHWLLDHRPNTEYGLNPDRLSDFGRVEFQRQEREADAYARLLRSSLKSLREVASAAPTEPEEEHVPHRYSPSERSAA